MARRPPSFFCRAMRRPPKKTGRTGCGQPRSRIVLTKAVKAVSKAGPEVLHITRSTKCRGLRPSGPPEEPAGNDLTAWRTSLSETCRQVESEAGGLNEVISETPE